VARNNLDAAQRQLDLKKSERERQLLLAALATTGESFRKAAQSLARRRERPGRAGPVISPAFIAHWRSAGSPSPTTPSPAIAEAESRLLTRASGTRP